MNMSPSVLDQKILLLKSKETDNYGKEFWNTDNIIKYRTNIMDELYS